MDANGRK